MSEFISHPIDTVIETCMVKNISFQELADELLMNNIELREFLSGDIPINVDIAHCLQTLLGVDESFWTNRQKLYDEKIKVSGKGELKRLRKEIRELNTKNKELDLVIYGLEDGIGEWQTKSSDQRKEIECLKEELDVKEEILEELRSTVKNIPEELKKLREEINRSNNKSLLL